MTFPATRRSTWILTAGLAVLWSGPLLAEGGVTFRDVAAGDGAGITYRRTPSPSKAIFDALKQDPTFSVDRLDEMPMKAWGAPGVALFDHDLDGDLDIYVTNGPGTANSLYSNQLRETGETAFVDVAGAAGVAATDQDSTGVCFGDLDNDGDADLVVLSHSSANRLFENHGDGTFGDVTAASGLAAGDVRASSGCTIGDVDNDGLLDLAIGNTYDDWDDYRGIDTEAYALNQHNRLFRNDGGLTFTDVSAASGIEALAGFAPEGEGAAGLTWAIALVDVDLDGDVDLLSADDQAGIPTPATGGVRRGMLHLFENDGAGRFTDVLVEAGLDITGAWMGLSFGDFDCDGHLDFFASNFGDFVPFALPTPGLRPSRWFLGQGDGTFTDPGVGALVTTPFGWGTSAADYDNDGDLDVIFHGGLDVGLGIEASNSGVVLRNPGCSAVFERDAEALAGSTDHGRRTVHGMAMGDLDENGFLDVVSVSNFDLPADVPLLDHAPLGSAFDDDARFHLTFDRAADGTLTWRGWTFTGGTLSVELSNGENGHGAVEVRPAGTVGVTRHGRVNRDGIGAVVRFRSPATPGEGVLQPVVGGSSYASQDALAVHFGLGTAERGDVEVLWPAGRRTRLYDVAAGERVVIPEIPCAFDNPEITFWGYLRCWLDELDRVVAAGLVSEDDRGRLLESAIRARRETVGDGCVVGGEFGDPIGEGFGKLEERGAEGGVSFVDIAAGGGAGIDYRRAPSASKALFDAIKNDPPYTLEKRNATPLKSRGAPGVALLDHDLDGDLDIYVTNGPGVANSLYSNQLRETGEVSFVDVAGAAGVAATEQDSTGVCFGDVDNDGDPDLLVVSHNAPSRFFENRGDGTFADMSEASGLAGGEVQASSGCSMGDVDGDGLLDVTIANTYDNWDHSLGLNVERFALNQHNQLFLNTGGNVFLDASAGSGVDELAGFPPENSAAAGLTWAIAMVDLDLDGDIDILNGDDQSGFPFAAEGGVDRGLLHFLENDGSGRFADSNLTAFGSKPGAWMGLTFGDFDCDGTLDFFASNFGDFNPFFEEPAGRRASRWFLGRGDGTWSDPGVGDLLTTPFGWGASAADYDNDGDLDVIFHGGLDVGAAIEASNDGVILTNPGCSARFVDGREALAGSTDHGRRTVHGMAVGDLDDDGFLDIVSVSNFDLPEDLEVIRPAGFGSPYDDAAQVHLSFEPDAAGNLVWVGSTFPDGTLSVELSSGGNGNGAARIRTLGTAGLTSGGRSNRDGIGAVVGFWSRGVPFPGTLLPVVGGSSYASQDALESHFGLGTSRRGLTEVLWPGGVRNRLYNVPAGERLVFPEIPCSFADLDLSPREYLDCLTGAFTELIEEGVLDSRSRARFFMSALRARHSVVGVTCSQNAAAKDEFSDYEAFVDGPRKPLRPLERALSLESRP